MNPYRPGDREHWEDQYGGTLHGSFDELWAQAEEYWAAGFAALNLPVWIDYDAPNEQEYDCGPTVQVGVLMPRHGSTWVHMAPATPEQVHRLQDLLARVWFRRADVGFPRYGFSQRVEPPDPA